MFLQTVSYELSFEENLTKDEKWLIRNHCQLMRSENIEAVSFCQGESQGNVWYIISFDLKFSEKELNRVEVYLGDEEEVDTTKELIEHIVNNTIDFIREYTYKRYTYKRIY